MTSAGKGADPSDVARWRQELLLQLKTCLPLPHGLISAALLPYLNPVVDVMVWESGGPISLKDEQYRDVVPRVDALGIEDEFRQELQGDWKMTVRFGLRKEFPSPDAFAKTAREDMQKPSLASLATLLYSPQYELLLEEVSRCFGARIVKLLRHDIQGEEVVAATSTKLFWICLNRVQQQ
eukprot:CAMPEP_0167772596 /NCGR_PEP_ID=MMETSP0111_2-20121227/934_1 /TAXON_ID=91324 /ORGANISM="Lotharella globosa, Strain CCCM811" /LENGTH=179 /DNA_ID=CAMNT_0007662103 /DNA_START=64 /DNA_END=603 /DNA_ORIENTATION=+